MQVLEITVALETGCCKGQIISRLLTRLALSQKRILCGQLSVSTLVTKETDDSYILDDDTLNSDYASHTWQLDVTKVKDHFRIFR